MLDVKKLSDQYNVSQASIYVQLLDLASQVQNAEILDLKQKVHDLDASIVTKDLFSQNLSSDIKALETENANLNAVVKVAQNVRLFSLFRSETTMNKESRNLKRDLLPKKRRLVRSETRFRLSKRRKESWRRLQH